MTKSRAAGLGLVFITFLSAMQYLFLQNVPENVSAFAFLFITDLIGLIVLILVRGKKFLRLRRSTLLKGTLAALELTGFNYFLLMGSHHLEPMVISGLVSMYFIFSTPMLILLQKKVNFFARVSSFIAIIGLFLMLGGDVNAIGTRDVLYLLISDVFFAAYVVTISALGSQEEPGQLTLSQILASVAISLIGWLIESAVSGRGFVLPPDGRFWISACFIGIFIRAIYVMIQLACQRHVPALSASMIFASEIILTLILVPLVSPLFGKTPVWANGFQIIGCILFVVAELMLDDRLMKRLGFPDLGDLIVGRRKNKEKPQRSFSGKMIIMTLNFTMLTLILLETLSLTAISIIRSSAVESSEKLGDGIASYSTKQMAEELETKMVQLTEDHARIAEDRLTELSSSLAIAASYAQTIYNSEDVYPDKEVAPPSKTNSEDWRMRRSLADESLKYEDLQTQCSRLGNMIDVFSPIIENHKDTIATIYIGTREGLLLSYDKASPEMEKAEDYYEFRDSVWYQQGIRKRMISYTGTYLDKYGRGLTVTCVAPFFDEEGQVAGCLGMDILISSMEKAIVNDGINAPNTALLLDKNGTVIAGGGFDPSSQTTLNILDDYPGNELKEAGSQILAHRRGLTAIGSGEDERYVSYAAIDSTLWRLCIISPISSVNEQILTIRESIDENTGGVVSSVVRSILTVIQFCLILSALIMLGVIFFVGKYTRKVTEPLIQLEKDVQEITRGDLTRHTKVDTNDEIGTLARSFNTMTDSLSRYMADLKEVTARDERIATELMVATRIQSAMLPSVFPPFPERKEFDIYALMDPAKEVGGDFYDFFMVDDRHLAIVMADVSGKGIPAALFMVVARTLIKNCALLGGSPSQIFSDVNARLCENNRTNFFVTAWLAIVDVTTGDGISVNAGHEYPALMHKDGVFELIRTRHSLALAAMEDVPFREHPFHLEKGDRLVMYTDGVTEATNVSEELFGDERLIASLNAHRTEDTQGLLLGLKNDIDSFVGEAQQFDDVTILTFDFYGPQEDGTTEKTSEQL